MEKGTDITLRQALNRFYDENSAVFSDRQASSDAQEFFRCHDVAHIVFGCDTTLFGEGILKIFTIFGTTLGFWNHLSSYAEANAFSLFRQYGVLHILRNIFWLLLSAPRAILRAKRMSRPWPWADHSQYLDRSLEEIRRDFNIEVIAQY